MADSPFPDEVPIPIPPPLQSALERDSCLITQHGKLVDLPQQPNVETILKDYYNHCVSGATDETNLSLLIEVLDGVKVYFDFMLADHLLYLEEQQQYREKMANNGKTESHHLAPGVQEVVLATPPSTVYGVEHLLRLFVKMPMFLSRARLPPPHTLLLYQYFKDLLGYLCSKKEQLLTEDHYITVCLSNSDHSMP